jgi:glycosyltransferase involved in cell wall biosynthesis
MRRALHVFPTFALGGAQRRLLALAEHMPGWSHQVLSIDGDLTAAAGASAIVAEPLPLRSTPFVSTQNLRKIRTVLTRDADLLCTYNWGSIEAVIANRLGPQLPHLHFEDGFGPDEAGGTKMQRDLARRLALKASHIVVPSRALRDIAAGRWRIPNRRLHHLPNGVDTTRFSPSPATDEKTVGWVGAFRSEKNVGRLVSAVAALHDRPKLMLVGEGPCRSSIMRACTDAGMDVDMPGGVADPAMYYRRFSVFALTSDTEQMPLTILEAMASGLPVVATDVGDIRDMVAAENVEFIVPLNKGVAGLTSAIGRLLADRAVRERIGKANRDRAVAEFGLPTMAARFAALFDAVASAADRP